MIQHTEEESPNDSKFHRSIDSLVVTVEGGVEVSDEKSTVTGVG
jgi:hypothetical protein